VRVGVADHLGWAVVVTVDGHRVIDRRRVELLDDGLPIAPVEHEVQALAADAALALLTEVRASIARVASAALDDLAATLTAPITSISLRAWPDDFPEDLATLRRPPYNARADAVMYRQEIAEIAHRRGWEVHLYDAKAVLAAVTDDILSAPRQLLGPPWTKDHRTALAAAITSGEA